jgi:hypothetical protein
MYPEGESATTKMSTGSNDLDSLIDGIQEGIFYMFYGNNRVVSELLRQDIEKYKNVFPHISAAIQLSNSTTEGRYPAKGILSTIFIQTHNIKIHF